MESLNYYRLMYEKGNHEVVINFLLNGDIVLGKQGYTYDSVWKEFTLIDYRKNIPIYDHQGAWAGTHYTHVYKGDSAREVGHSTYYSLY